MFYFNGGSYPAMSLLSSLTLNNGQSVSSRTADYSAPATGSARSTFNGGFSLSGNNQLENIILAPQGGIPNSGVTVTGPNNQISGSDIGSMTNRYLFGVEDTGTSTQIEGTNIFASQIGVISVGSNTIIDNSSVNVLNNTGITGVGVSMSSSDVSINDSNILITGPTPTSNTGVRTSVNSVASLNNTTVSVENTGSGSAVALENNSNTIGVSAGTLIVNGTNPSIATGMPVDIIFGTVCMINGVVSACP